MLVKISILQAISELDVVVVHAHILRTREAMVIHYTDTSKPAWINLSPHPTPNARTHVHSRTAAAISYSGDRMLSMLKAQGSIPSTVETRNEQGPTSGIPALGR